VAERVDVAVLGGGIAGLVSAHELVRRGYSVAILEREPYVGGLARTVEHGPYRFDQGGHRFHSDDPRILDWVDTLMGDRVLHVPRKSRIAIRGTWVSYPLVLTDALTAFGLFEATRMGASYMRSKITRRNGTSGNRAETFEDWVTARFGKRLFDIYFRPYTEKVWGLPCNEISSRWASERISSASLWKTVYKSVFKFGKTPKSLVNRFRYFRTGIGELSHRLAEEIEAKGPDSLHLGTTVTALEKNGEGWTVRVENAVGEARTIEAKRLVSTIPITILPRLLPDGPEKERAITAASKLGYRGVVCVMAGVKRETLSDDTWIYFPEQSCIFGRLHEPKNWSKEMVPEGRTSFCLEIFASPGEDNWSRDDESIVAECAETLESFGFLKTDEVEWPRVVRVPGAYPVWNVGFEEPLGELRGALEDLGGIHPVGRTGNFEYLNIDGVVARVWDLVDELLVADGHGAPDRGESVALSWAT